MTTHKIRYDSHLDIGILALIRFISKVLLHCVQFYGWRAGNKTAHRRFKLKVNTLQPLNADSPFPKPLETISLVVLHKRRKSIEFEMNMLETEMITLKHTHIHTHERKRERATEAESSLIKVLYASLEVFYVCSSCFPPFALHHSLLTYRFADSFSLVLLISTQSHRRFGVFFRKWKRRANRTEPLSCNYLVAFLFYIRSKVYRSVVVVVFDFFYLCSVVCCLLLKSFEAITNV